MLTGCCYEQQLKGMPGEPRESWLGKEYPSSKTHMQIIEIDWKYQYILCPYPHPDGLLPSLFLGVGVGGPLPCEINGNWIPLLPST